MQSSPTPHDMLQPRLDGHLFCDAPLVSSVIHPSELLWVDKPCLGYAKNSISCRNPNRVLFEQECKGLKLTTKPIHNGITIPIQNISVLTKKQFDTEPSLLPHTVGVRLRDILLHPPYYNSRSKQWVHPTDMRVNKNVLKHRAFTGKQVILFSTDIDTVIEPFWAQRDDTHALEDIAGMGFYAITGINFSLFVGECPYAQRLNMNRSLMYSHLLDQLGVTVIPHTYALNDTQREALVAYLRANPSAATVTINTQLLRSPKSIAMLELSKTIEYLLTKTNVKIILHGRRPAQWKPEWASRVVLANHAGLVTSAIVKKTGSVTKKIAKKAALVHPDQLTLPLNLSVAAPIQKQPMPILIS